MLGWIAARLILAGGGHPQKACICKLFQRVDGDPDWYPGKQTTNNWDLACLSEAEREWVEANCVAVHVAEPVFQQRDGKRQRLISS